MRLLYNNNIKGSKEYTEQQYKLYCSGDLQLKEVKKIKNEWITGYHKMFIDDKYFHPVKEQLNCQHSYIEHVKNSCKKFLVDHDNKILVCIR